MTTNEPVITARYEAIEGHMRWASPRTETPCMADVITQGYVAIQFDGDRTPRRAKCVGCRKLASKAWHITPIDFTVAACSGDCVADAVEKLWRDAICVRVRGRQARKFITPVVAA